MAKSQRKPAIHGRVPFGDGAVTHHSISEERDLFSTTLITALPVLAAKVEVRRIKSWRTWRDMSVVR